MDAICEPYTRNHALDHIAAGRIVIFAAGTGSPFFTTDSAAALPVGRVGTADDIACQIVACMEIGFMTGTVIFLDGGGSFA